MPTIEMSNDLPKGWTTAQSGTVKENTPEVEMLKAEGLKAELGGQPPLLHLRQAYAALMSDVPIAGPNTLLSKKRWRNTGRRIWTEAFRTRSMRLLDFFCENAREFFGGSRCLILY